MSALRTKPIVCSVLALVAGWMLAGCGDDGASANRSATAGGARWIHLIPAAANGGNVASGSDRGSGGNRGSRSDGTAGVKPADPVKAVNGDGYFVVTAKETQLYHYGPAQASGADAMLKEGRRVIMLRHEYGYSRVKTEDNFQTGFVANEHIAPAPPPRQPLVVSSGSPFRNSFGNVPPLPSRGTSVPGVSSANRAVIQTGPLFGGSELPPLPDADGKAKPKPGFRINAPTPPPSDSDDKSSNR